MAPDAVPGLTFMGPVAALALLAWVYRRGANNRSSGPQPATAGRKPNRRRKNCFAVALVMVAVALGPPLEPLAHGLASAHMVQHLLLIMAVAPLWAAARPGARLTRGLPAVIRSPVERLRSAPARMGVTTGRRIVLWTVLCGAAIAWWHTPYAHQVALDHPLVHVSQHLTLLGTGVGWCSALLRSRRGTARHVGLGMLACFVLSLQTALLGALLTFSAQPWYRYHPEDLPFRNSPDPLTDQQVAGLLMWVPMGLWYLALALWLLLSVLREAPVPTTKEKVRPIRNSMVSG